MLLRLAAIAIVCTLATLTTPPAGAVTVSAAISLSGPLEEIAKAYQASGGGEVRFNFAGSNTLARQIVNGAPVDVFISADEQQMDVVEKAGRLHAGSRTTIVGNQLAVVTSPERAAYVRDQFTRAPPDIRRLALGDPEAVPAGVYARAYLEKLGVWKAYESRIVPTANVRAALTAVDTGAADAAIVYVTDVNVAEHAVVAFVVPIDRAPRIVYPGALTTAGGRRPEAARFLTFLRGPAATAVFARYKFLPAK